jgi:CRP-like cAMP-binding protein
VLVILRGSVKVITISADGHERLLAVRGPGEIIGEVSAVWHVPRSATVQATAEVEILSIPDRAFIRVLRRFPATMMELFRISGERRRDADLERAEFSGLPVARRIASVLVKLAAHRHAQDDGTIPLPLTQDDLASLAGTSRSSVARALATLRAEGVLVTAPRQIILVDPERLRSNIGGVSSDTAPAKEIR